MCKNEKKVEILLLYAQQLLKKTKTIPIKSYIQSILLNKVSFVFASIILKHEKKKSQIREIFLNALLL